MDVLAGQANVGGNGDNTVPVRNGFRPAIGRYLAPFRRGVLFVSEAAFRRRLDFEGVGLNAVRS